MAWFNYHTHTYYSDGARKPENYIRKAIKKKMFSLGFTDHAPVSVENDWCIPEDRLLNYSNNILALKEKYKDIIVLYLGLEIDYIPTLTMDFNTLKEKHNLDYVIGSIHLVKDKSSDQVWFIDGPSHRYKEGLEKIFCGDIREGVEAFYRQSIEMVQTQKPDIIGHLDKIKMNNKGKYFNENDEWHKKYIRELLEVICNNNTIVEINTRGLYTNRYSDFYPALWIIKECNQKGIPLTLSSDAHRPFDLTGCFKKTARILKESGIKELMILKNHHWLPAPFDEKGIIDP